MLPKNTAKSIISVTLGNLPAIETNEYFVDTETAVIKSDEFLRHTGETLGLSNKWELPEDEVVTKLRNSISVQAGNEPGQIVITTHGLEHQTAINVLNELCDFYSSQKLWNSENRNPRQKVNVTIVQRAK